MTYREQREAKAGRLREWAGKREQRDTERSPAEQALDAIPFGQPILVGHHSERRHRNAIERAHNATGRRIESLSKADDMRARADNIERAAKQAIYSDDPDAVDALRAKLARLEATRAKIKATNADFRKAHKAELKGMTAYERDQALPHQGYELQNLGGNISRTRKRIASLERENATAGERGYGKPMQARYAGECAECGTAVDAGESMTYYRRTREVVCASCEGSA